jgi:type VI secretion system protein ImpL
MRTLSIKEVARVVLFGVGICSLASLVYLAGPLISFGGYHPLQGYIGRELAVLVLVAAVGSFAGFKFWQRKKNAKALAAGVSGAEQKESDESVLKDKMKDALATLKTASGGKKDYLYDLPWYLLIGPPGSGKTTALINSGLKFPLSRGTPAAIAGLGGTRYCDWWFTEDAVLIDTAGRYTTQDSDAQTDKQSWLAFLAMLKKNRPRQPINGVIVAISLEDLLTLSSADLAAHSNAIRTRLIELHERLKVDFPVYALFTKGDLVAGFMEYFGYLGDQGRKQVWGATFQTADKSRNMVTEIPVEYDLLLERLSEETLDRLQDEPVPDTRVLLFGFPAQMARLKKPIYDFLNQIFEPTRYHVSAALRGFYFTSGTQEGNPIDQLIGALVRTFGAEEIPATSLAGQGKSYFLHDLILKVIIGEAAWVSTDWAAVRRAMIIKAAVFSAIALVSIGASAAWLTSYQRNRTLIEATDLANTTYEKDAGNLARANIVGDHDLHLLLGPLYELRNMPAGYGTRDASTPFLAGFGLSQRERLLSSSENAYRIGLERMFRSRLLFRLEQQLDAQLDPKLDPKDINPGFLYEALKVYLMVGRYADAQEDRNLIRSWMRRDWEALYPDATNAAGRKALAEHLDAMLDLESGEPLIDLSGRLIEDSQKALARMSVTQRAYELLKSQARAATAGDWVAAQKGGPDVALVFEAPGDPTLESVRVPEFFTYYGFQHDFVDRLGDIAERINKDRWVLGAAGEQGAVAAQYTNLPDDLLVLYSRDFITAWREGLGKLRLRKLTADKPRYIGLSAISAPTSPLKQLIESIVQETALTRERPAAANAQAAAGSGQANAAPAKAPAVLFKTTQGRAPGTEIEAQFKPYQVLIEGDVARRPIEDIVSTLNEINSNLGLAATTPSQVQRAVTSLQEEASKLRSSSGRFPKPFSDMMLGLASDVEHEVGLASAGQLQVAMRDKVTPTCLQTIQSYPFVKSDTRGVPPDAFGRLFGAGGLMDTFFKQNLEPYVDTSKSPWTWRQNSELARTLSPETLRAFQRAYDIQHAFFQNNGSTPFVQLTVKPSYLSYPGAVAKFEIGGATVNSPTPQVPPPAMAGAPPPMLQPTSATPVLVQWPGGSPLTRITFAMGPNAPPNEFFKVVGPWSMFKVFEAGGLSVRGDNATVRYSIGGQVELTYELTSNASFNPLNLAALREFKCPSGI